MIRYIKYLVVSEYLIAKIKLGLLCMKLTGTRCVKLWKKIAVWTFDQEMKYGDHVFGFEKSGK